MIHVFLETDGDMLNQMGCKSDTASFTITKRSTHEEETKWDPFNISHYFYE